MSLSQFETTVTRERLLKGERNWWFLGPGGRARLSAKHIDTDGTLLPTVEQNLRDKGLFDIADYSTYALTVLTSTDCNLGCGYCFQNTGQDTTGGNRPPRIKHSRLTPETTTKILEFAAAHMVEADFKHLSIMLFGGEPMLNPKGAKDLLTRAKDYGLKFASMTSNGTLLTPLLARDLADLGLRDVQITFDGAKEEHDRIRVRRSGGGTFDAIVHNIREISKITDIWWRLRVNVSHHNIDSVSRLLEQLGQELDTSHCSINFARIGDVGVGYRNDLKHTENFSDTVARWQRRALELGFTVPTPGANTPCKACSFRDGRFGAVVSADGQLFSCWESAGKPDWTVGSVSDGYLPTEVTEPRWNACEDFYSYQESERAVDTFQDVVDAKLLDHLHATGRL